MPVQRIAAIGAGGVGVVSIILGSYFGLHAKSELADSNAGNCHANNLCNATGVSERSSAEASATASTAFFVVGILGLAGGATLWFLTPRRSAAHASVAPWLDPHARTGGVVLDAAF
jgi:hypothetical protein